MAFFRCLSNSGTFTELRTTSFIESTGVACSDYVSHNRVQVLSIPVLLLACSQDWTNNLQMIVSLEAEGTNAYNRYAMCPAEGSRVRQTPEEGRRTYRPKRYNKDEDKSPKTLNDKNHQASSQKFRQLIILCFIKRPKSPPPHFSNALFMFSALKEWNRFYFSSYRRISSYSLVPGRVSIVKKENASI